MPLPRTRQQYLDPQGRLTSNPYDRHNPYINPLTKERESEEDHAARWRARPSVAGTLGKAFALASVPLTLAAYSGAVQLVPELWTHNHVGDTLSALSDDNKDKKPAAEAEDPAWLTEQKRTGDDGLVGKDYKGVGMDNELGRIALSLTASFMGIVLGNRRRREKVAAFGAYMADTAVDVADATADALLYSRAGYYGGGYHHHDYGGASGSWGESSSGDGNIFSSMLKGMKDSKDGRAVLAIAGIAATTALVAGAGYMSYKAVKENFFAPSPNKPF